MLDDLGVRCDFVHDKCKRGALDELCRHKKYLEKPVVFLSRDPRDMAVSYYFEKTVRGGRDVGTMSDFVRSPEYGVERIACVNLTWLERGSGLPAFLPITYEEARANPTAVLRGILAFVGADLSEARIKQVVAENTFEKMRQREGSGEYDERYGRDLKAIRPNDPESFKVRRGKIGGYLDYLSAEDIAYCEEVLVRHRYFDDQHRLMGGNHSRTKCGL
jgi:hypothetical protein